MKAAILLIVLLSGCALTPEQEKAEFDAQVEQMRLDYGEGCKAYGVERSPAWVNCVVGSHNRALALRAAFWRAFGMALGNYGNTVYGPEATRAQQFSTTPIPAYQPPRQIDCQSFGNRINCTQY